MNNLTVRSSVNGIVKKVGDPIVDAVNESPLIVVSSESGLYLKGTITEHQLGKVEVGQLVDVMSWGNWRKLYAQRLLRFTLIQLMQIPTQTSMLLFLIIHLSLILKKRAT